MERRGACALAECCQRAGVNVHFNIDKPLRFFLCAFCRSYLSLSLTLLNTLNAARNVQESLISVNLLNTTRPLSIVREEAVRFGS